MHKEYRNKDGKLAGILNVTMTDSRVYGKVVNRSKHLMKMFQGYGISKEIFDELRKDGCTEIRIREEDTGNVYTVPFSVFDEHKIEKNFDGPQCFIQGKYLIPKH